MFSLASIATMTACIFLFGLFYSIVTNFQAMVKDAESGVAVTVFFDVGISEQRIEEIGDLIKQRVEVSHCEYTSADEAWESFKDVYFDGNEDAASSFAGDNPLANSASYSIYMNDISMQSTLVTYLESIDGIRSVKQSEMVAHTLTDFNSLIGYISAGIILILLGVAVFLISNTITVGISVRREEIGIMKLIGATDYFVRAPFVVEGIVIGLIGAAIPLGILYVLYEKIILYIGDKFKFISNMIQFFKCGPGIPHIGSCGTVTWCWYWIYWKPDYDPQTFKGMIINKRQWIHRITAVLLIVMTGMAATVQMTSAAENSSAKKSENTSTSLKEAQQEKAALEKALEKAKQTINELKESKGDVQAKVNDLNTQLMNISSRITALENQLAQKNQELTEKKDQIEDTKDQLEDAKSRKSSSIRT